MSITETTSVPLEGEQGQVFAELDAEEQQATQGIKARRNAAVQAVLAGKGLLSQITPGTNINVDARSGVITLTPPQKALAVVE